MSDFSERVQARLKTLAETFTRQLPTRMQDISDAARAALVDEPDPKAYPALRMSVHKLAGSAASFGFHHVTVCAKRLEHVVDLAIEDGGHPDGSTRKRIRMLVSELGESTRSHARADEEDLEELPGESSVELEVDASAGVGSTPGASAIEPADLEELAPDAGSRSVRVSKSPDFSERFVSILVRPGQLGEDCSEQLSFYGFVLQEVETLEDLVEVARTGRRVAFILDVATVLANEGAGERLASMKAEGGDHLHIVYVSDRDDFATRRAAVQAGGDAFFSVPIDSSRLIDKVDSLTTAAAEDPYHVLIVDDDMEQVGYHAMVLQQAGMITSLVSDPEHMFSILIESKPELILMDMYMPGCSGSDLATIIRQQEAFVDIPIVFLSIETDTEKQIEAISRGGDGFLSKPVKPEHLVATVANRVERARSMRFFMERDSLTGLLNHTHLIHNLSKEIQRAERVGRPVCFAMIDIDHFKGVNDTYGHLTGDRVLKSLTRHLQDKLRKTDLIGRYGGEEFGVVLFNVDLDTAKRVMDKVREEFARVDHDSGDTRFPVTFSCGIAAYPEYDGPGPISEAADKALYAAKAAGRNQVVTI